MPFGKYKGKMLVDIPASYLLWLNDNVTELDKGLKEYIKNNWHDLNKDYEETKSISERNYKARD